MEAFTNFLNVYGVKIILAILTCVASYIGIAAKKIYKKYIDNDIKQSVVSTCVKAVEQIYTDIHGEAKLQKAMEMAASMLSNKGINITDEDLKIMIEAAVGTFNNAFHNHFPPAEHPEA